MSIFDDPRMVGNTRPGMPSPVKQNAASLLSQMHQAIAAMTQGTAAQGSLADAMGGGVAGPAGGAAGAAGVAGPAGVAGAAGQEGNDTAWIGKLKAEDERRERLRTDPGQDVGKAMELTRQAAQGGQAGSVTPFQVLQNEQAAQNKVLDDAAKPDMAYAQEQAWGQQPSAGVRMGQPGETDTLATAQPPQPAVAPPTPAGHWAKGEAMGDVTREMSRPDQYLMGDKDMIRGQATLDKSNRLIKGFEDIQRTLAGDAQRQVPSAGGDFVPIQSETPGALPTVDTRTEDHKRYEAEAKWEKAKANLLQSGPARDARSAIQIVKDEILKTVDLNKDRIARRKEAAGPYKPGSEEAEIYQKRKLSQADQYKKGHKYHLGEGENAQNRSHVMGIVTERLPKVSFQNENWLDSKSLQAIADDGILTEFSGGEHGVNRNIKAILQASERTFRKNLKRGPTSNERREIMLGVLLNHLRAQSTQGELELDKQIGRGQAGGFPYLYSRESMWPTSIVLDKTIAKYAIMFDWFGGGQVPYGGEDGKTDLSVNQLKIWLREGMEEEVFTQEHNPASKFKFWVASQEMVDGHLKKELDPEEQWLQEGMMGLGSNLRTGSKDLWRGVGRDAAGAWKGIRHFVAGRGGERDTERAARKKEGWWKDIKDLYKNASYRQRLDQQWPGNLRSGQHQPGMGGIRETIEGRDRHFGGTGQLDPTQHPLYAALDDPQAYKHRTDAGSYPYIKGGPGRQYIHQQLARGKADYNKWFKHHLLAFGVPDPNNPDPNQKGWETKSFVDTLLTMVEEDKNQAGDPTLIEYRALGVKKLYDAAVEARGKGEPEPEVPGAFDLDNPHDLDEQGQAPAGPKGADIPEEEVEILSEGKKVKADGTTAVSLMSEEDAFEVHPNVEDAYGKVSSIVDKYGKGTVASKDEAAVLDQKSAKTAQDQTFSGPKYGTEDNIGDSMARGKRLADELRPKKVSGTGKTRAQVAGTIAEKTMQYTRTALAEQVATQTKALENQEFLLQISKTMAEAFTMMGDGMTKMVGGLRDQKGPTMVPTAIAEALTLTGAAKQAATMRLSVFGMTGHLFPSGTSVASMNAQLPTLQHTQDMKQKHEEFLMKMDQDNFQAYLNYHQAQTGQQITMYGKKDLHRRWTEELQHKKEVDAFTAAEASFAAQGAAQGEAKLGKLELDTIEALRKTIMIGETVIKLKPMHNTGFFKNYYESIGNHIGYGDPDWHSFKQLVTIQLNVYVNELTGKQLSRHEVARLKGAVPQISDDDAIFMAKAKTFVHLQKAILRRKLAIYAVNGHDVSGQMAMMGLKWQVIGKDGKKALREGTVGQFREWLTYEDGHLAHKQGRVQMLDDWGRVIRKNDESWLSDSLMRSYSKKPGQWSTGYNADHGSTYNEAYSMRVGRGRWAAHEALETGSKLGQFAEAQKTGALTPEERQRSYAGMDKYLKETFGGPEKYKEWREEVMKREGRYIPSWEEMMKKRDEKRRNRGIVESTIGKAGIRQGAKQTPGITGVHSAAKTLIDSAKHGATKVLK